MSEPEEQKDQSEVNNDNKENLEQSEGHLQQDELFNHEEEKNQSNNEDISVSDTVEQTVGGLMSFADKLTNDQETNEDIENEEDTHEINANIGIEGENNFNNEEEKNSENNEDIKVENTDENEMVLNNFQNAGTKLQIGDDEEESNIKISYQNSGYSPNLRNSQSFAIEQPITIDGNVNTEAEINDPHRTSQSQRVGQPIEPSSSRNKVAPRPNSQKRAGNKKQPIRVETIVDDDRPMSSCSSYSYTYSYSEVEEEITRPVRHRRAKKDYVPDYIKAQLEQSRAQQTQQLMMLSDEELEKFKKKALDLQPLENLSDDVYSAVLNSLIEDRNVHASAEHFKECERLNHAIEHVNHCQMEQRKYNLQNESYQGMMDQLDDIEMQLTIFDAETKTLENDVIDQTNKQLNRVKEKHQKELDEIQDKWNEESKMRQYNRASPRLVFLRKQFKQLMRQCKFAEAEETKSLIQRLEIQEREKAEATMSTRFQDAVSKVEARQEEEVKFYQTKGDIRLKKLKVDRLKLREAITNKQKKVEEMRDVINDPDKLWNYNMSQKKKNQPSANSTTKSVFGTTMMQNNANLSRLTSRDFTDREETTLALPPLKLNRNTRRTAKK